MLQISLNADTFYAGRLRKVDLEFVLEADEFATELNFIIVLPPGFVCLAGSLMGQAGQLLQNQTMVHRLELFCREPGLYPLKVAQIFYYNRFSQKLAEHDKTFWIEVVPQLDSRAGEEIAARRGGEGCDITAVTNHLHRLTHLNPLQKIDLAKLLLSTLTLSNPQGLQNVVALLNRQIRYNLQSGTTTIFDVLNLIDVCSNFPNGLSSLITIVFKFEGDSLPMNNLCQFILSLENSVS